MRKMLLFLTASILVIFSTTVMAAKVHEYTLKNGLTILVKRDTRAPIVVSQLWYKVGSSYEPQGITGISHALEHMMFEGTKQISGQAFTRMIVKVGGTQNAMTSRDYTVYFEKLPVKELGMAMRLEADRMQHLAMTQKSFAKEMQVVKEERRLRVEDKPQSLTYERFLATAFVSSPYHHMPIGWMDDLNNMKLAALKKWYQTWYAPNNAILVVVGDIEPHNVFALAKHYFGDIPKKTLPQPLSDKEVKPLGMREVDVNIPAKLPWLAMGYLVPSLATVNKDVSWKPYALTVLGAVLDGGQSARLPAKLVRKDALATDVSVDYDITSRLKSLFVIAGTPAQGHTLTQLQKAFLAQVKALQTTPITAQELARVKAQVVAQKVFSEDSQFYQGMMLGHLAAVNLPYQIAGDYVKNIDKVTPQQVQEVAKEFLTKQRLTIGRLIPQPIDQKNNTQTQSTNG